MSTSVDELHKKLVQLRFTSYKCFIQDASVYFMVTSKTPYSEVRYEISRNFHRKADCGLLGYCRGSRFSLRLRSFEFLKRERRVGVTSSYVGFFCQFFYIRLQQGE